MSQLDNVADRRTRDRDCHDGTIQPALAELVSALVRGAGIEEMLTKLTSASVALVSGAEIAKISLIEDEHLRSLAVTSELAALLDGAQRAAGQGPCLEAINAQKPIRCSDLRTDVRWPRFAAAATAAGVRSVLSCPLDMPGVTGATLSLFGCRPEAFGTGSDTAAAMLANHAAIALVAAEHERQFKAALTTRDVIGQAKGVIMERFRVDSAGAFAMLKRISQQTKTPVRQLAVMLVERTGTRDDEARKNICHNNGKTGDEHRSRPEGKCSR